MEDKQINDSEKQADILIAEDKVTQATLETAHEEAWGSFGKYTVLKFIPIVNIYYYFQMVGKISNFESLKYGRPKSNIYVAFGLASLMCFIVITTGGSLFVHYDLPGYSYLFLFIFTIITSFLLFETWLRSKR